MFHVEHFPNFLFLMALDIVQYNSGDPITAGTTYQIPGEMNSEAWILQSTTQGAVFQMTATAPTDEDWSNIQDTQFHINGTVTGLILPILSNGYFRVVKEPVTEHATMALVEQEFQMEVADPINPFVAGTSVAPGYYDLSSLNLEAGKMYVLSVLPVQDKDYPETPGIVTDETFSAVIVGLTGTKATQVILRGVTTVGSHLFVMTGAKPILHLGGRSNVKFNITVSPVVFSSGSGDSLTPSSDANITGAWSFTNITVPTPTQAGQAANKSYVDSAVASVPRFDTSEDYVLTGTWGFEMVPMTSAQPSVPNDIANKGYVDGQDVLLQNQIDSKVDTQGNQTVNGVKTFTGGVTLADEAPLTFGVGADAVKFHGTGAGKAVIEGGNATKLDVAVPVNLQEPITAQDTLTFDNTTITNPRNSITFNGPNKVSSRIAQSVDGNLHFGPVTGGGLTIRTDGVVALSNYAYLKGATFESAVTIGSTITVSGGATFDKGITMKDEAPILLGQGDNALKIHGTGAGMSVIEGGTGAHLDVAVSTTFQEPTVFQDATTFSTMIKAEKGISFGITEGSSAMETLMEQNHPTLSAYGCKWTYTANNGYYQLVQRNNTVWLTFDPTGNVWFRKKFEVQGPATFTQGVTMGQTLNVAGLVTFTGDLAMAEDKLIYLSAQVNMGAISGGSVSLNGAPTGKFNTNLAIETSQGIKASGKISANGGLETTGTTSLGGGLSDLTTINGTLTVTGRITASEGITLPEGLDIMFGSSASIYSDSSSNIMIEGSAAGRTLLNQALRFPTDSVFESTTGVNIETGDARYLRFVSTTKAAYDALTTKDPTTIYLITDTTPRMLAIGDMEIVTAGVPA